MEKGTEALESKVDKFQRATPNTFLVNSISAPSNLKLV